MANELVGSDEFFRRGWLADPELAERCLQRLAKLAVQLTRQGASEADTGAIFVEPLLRGLGWETLDHDEVDRAPRGPYPDYELYARRADSTGLPRRVAVIEVKALGTPDEHLLDARPEGALGELRRYVAIGPSGTPGKPDQVVMLGGEPVVCGAVTDGNRWHIYDFRGACGERQDPRCVFDLALRGVALRAFAEALGRRELAVRFGA